MKLTYLKFRLLLLLTVLFCSENVWSQTSLDKAFTANWVSIVRKERGNVRLCDLSIPEAHDAATHDAILDYVKDQKYDEKSLFEQGVRSFDMRLYKKEGKKPCFSHGGIDMNDMDDEINNHFPDSTALKGEFMFIFFQNEGGSDNDSEKMKAFNEFISLLVKKYGQKNFVGFRKDLTIDDVQGKIILVSGESYYKPDNITDAQNRVPIAKQTDGKDESKKFGEEYGRIYRDSKIVGYDSNNAKIKSIGGDTLGATLFEQNNYDKNQDDKKKSITKDFEGDEHVLGWFPYLKSNDGNKDCVFHKAQINSYYTADKGRKTFENISSKIFGDWVADKLQYIGYAATCPGSEIARDGLFSTGCNHHTHDLLQKYTLPYGFVRFDFIAEKSHGIFTMYGDRLLEQIVLNNFHAQGGNFITELAISRDKDANVSGNLLSDKGYANPDFYTNKGVFTFDPKDVTTTLIGFKASNYGYNAITNLFVYVAPKNTTPEDSVVGPDGRNYHLITHLQNTNDDWKGDMNVDTDGDMVFLYVTKDPGTKILKTINLVDEIELLSNKEEREFAKMYALNGSEWELVSDSANINSGATAMPLLLAIETHEHSAPEKNFKDFDQNTHWKECPVCYGYLDIAEHTMTLVDSTINNHHYHKCTDPDCNYMTREECKADSYSEQGFGVCSICHTDCDEKPTISNDTIYISNPGQLYWFAKKENNEYVQQVAVLANDIDFEGIDFNEKPWDPIGNIDNPFCGHFEGQGHVISGIKYSGNNIPEDSRSGLFGYVEKGTIRNLGIVNSSFSGYDHVGSIAGEIKNAVIENVFSTATTKSEREHFCGGLFGAIEYSFVDYGFYYGKTQNYKALGPIYGQNTFVFDFYSPFAEDAPITSVPDSLFTNGYVCKMLNDSMNVYCDFTYVPWGQELGKDTLPVFRGKTLYQYRNCSDKDIYTNDSTLDGATDVHDFSEKVLSENAIDGLHSYVCKFDNNHLSDDRVIKNYDGSHNLELKTGDEGYYVEELDLTDAKKFYSPVDFTAKIVNDSRIATSDTMTIILPFDVTGEALNGSVYKLASCDGKNLYFSIADGIEANTPCILSVGKIGEEIIQTTLENVTIKASEPIEVVDTTSNIALKGVYDTTDFFGGEVYHYYYFDGNQFVKGDNYVELMPFNAAVELKKGESIIPSTLGIVLGDENISHVTEIEQTMTGKVNVYDATGRTLRLKVEAEESTNGLKPGIYVVNGKKVIIVK